MSKVLSDEEIDELLEYFSKGVSEKREESGSMNLYRIENGMAKDWYIIAEHPTEAQEMLESALKDENYGFTEHRKTVVIHLVAEQIVPALNHKHFFSSGNKLMIKGGL